VNVGGGTVVRNAVEDDVFDHGVAVLADPTVRPRRHRFLPLKRRPLTSVGISFGVEGLSA